MIKVVIFKDRMHIRVSTVNDDTLCCILNAFRQYRITYERNKVTDVIVVYGSASELYNILLELTYDYELLIE